MKQKLVKYAPRAYSELIRSDIPGSSSVSPYRSFLFLVFAEEPKIQRQQTGQAILARSRPVPVEKNHQFSAICGNDSSFTNKVDLSATDGIDSDHK